LSTFLKKKIAGFCRAKLSGDKCVIFLSSGSGGDTSAAFLPTKRFRVNLKAARLNRRVP
jgi:hypothetical protein